MVTFGAISFDNSGGRARISKVTLVGADHLDLAAAWVVPITWHALLGNFLGYPPSGRDGQAGPPGPGVRWADRQRADGAVIPHIPSKETINLVLVLKPSGEAGTANSERVYYQSDHTRYLLVIPVRLKVLNGKPSC